MGRLIINLAMTVDGVIDVSDWFVAEGNHDDEARSLFEGDTVLLVGRKNYEGFAGYWPTQTGPWADLLNPMPKYVVSKQTPRQARVERDRCARRRRGCRPPAEIRA